MCGLDVPWGGCPGARAYEVSLFPWLRCVLQPRPCRIRKAEQRLDWAISRCLAVFNILGLFLPSALLAGGREEAEAWQQDPGLPGPGEPAPAGLRGGRGCGNAACSPIPSGGEHTQAFSPAFRLLGVGLNFIRVVRGTVGRRSGWPHWMDRV